MGLLLLRRNLLLTSKTAAIIAPNRLLRAALRRFSSGASPTVCDSVPALPKLLTGVDEVTLVAGDGDYVPIAEHLIERGLKFDERERFRGPIHHAVTATRSCVTRVLVRVGVACGLQQSDVLPSGIVHAALISYLKPLLNRPQ